MVDMRANSSFDGWERYPENLDIGTINAYKYDFSEYGEQLRADAKRLFSSDEQLNMKVLEFGQGENRRINSLHALEAYLLETPKSGSTRVFLLPQEYSWGSLVISLEAICKLFTSLAVYPAFIDVLRAFGEKTDFEDDSYTGFRLQANVGADISESSYLIKHVEEHGREQPANPWSVRQMGVYHQSGGTREDVFLIVNPSRSFLRRMKQVQQLPVPPKPWEIHMIVLSCMMEKWRWCISDLERSYTTTKTKAQLSTIVDNTSKESSITDIHFEDTQDLQVLQDYAIRLCQFLGMNRNVVDNVHHNRSHFVTGSAVEVDNNFIASLVTDVDEQIRRVETVLRRLDGTLGLVRSILDIRCLESLRSNSTIMNTMTHLSREENAMILELTQKASRDTDTLKTLTLLTLVYLPASFVASMMSMGYISTGRGEPGHRVSGQGLIHVTGEFWIFLVLTLLLLTITLCSYFFWLRSRLSGSQQTYSRTYRSL